MTTEGDLLPATVALMVLWLAALVAGVRVSSRRPGQRTVALAAVVLAALRLFVSARYHGT